MSYLKRIEKIVTGASQEDEVLNSYFETMLWSSNDLESEEPLDANYGIEDLSHELKEQSKKDVKSFLEQAEKVVDLNKYDNSQIGHDFWLTRNGHGAGFWDGDYDDNDGKLLTELSKKFKHLDPYVGDDGKIYT